LKRGDAAGKVIRNRLEAIFQHAPDGGNGSAATLLLLVVFAGVVARLAGLRRNRAAKTARRIASTGA
jgi:hypothetical protein